MSDAVTSTSAAPAPQATAQPAAVARADVSESQDAVKLLREIRAKRGGDKNKLKLVPKQEPDAEAADEQPTSEASASEAASSPETAEGADAEGADDKPPEKEPTWAQKLRADLTKKTEQVKQLEQRDREREAKFNEAAQRVQWQIEDVQADVKAEQAYSQMLEQAIESAGFSVPADWKRAALAERKASALERQLQRGQTAQQKQGHEKAGERAVQSLHSLGERIPEVKAALSNADPEMRAWLAERFGVDEQGKPTGLGMKNLERDAANHAKALRYERTTRAQAKKTTAQVKPAEGARPQSTTLAGQGSGAGQKRLPAVPRDQNESMAFLAARRAARK